MRNTMIARNAPLLKEQRQATDTGEPEAGLHSAQAQRCALVVLGPHRSGTSPLTRVLSLSGAALPSHILPAHDGLPGDGNTEAGFWESKILMTLHEEALASAGSRWDDPFGLLPSWFDSEIAKDFTGRLVEALTAEFGDAPLFVAKDPRISRLAPLWKAALEALRVEANWVITVRNPLDVAASLNRRDGFPQPKGLLLWLTYFLDAERHTRDHERSFVLYDDLLKDWRRVIKQIADRFGLSFSRRTHFASAEIDDFLKIDLQHHATTTSELAIREDVAGWVKDTFQWALKAVAEKPTTSKALDNIYHLLCQAESVYGPLLAMAERETQKKQEQKSQLVRQVDELQHNLTKAGAELAEQRQLAEKRQREITMLKIERDEEVKRLRDEMELSLQTAVEREDQRDKAHGELKCEVSSMKEPLAQTPASRVKAIAFYLPQYHPIPENNQWWGRGFTEWTNVTKARPCFRGHRQPLLPSELGFYDLRVPEVRAQQAALAREHGIHGFCYYYYWFSGRKILERPLEEMLASGEPDFPFCLCWANENWTRRWDGEDQEILIEQKHSPQSDARFIDDVLPAFLDPRYIKCNGKPLLLVYRADLLADPVATASVWREAARRAGLPGLHLCSAWRVENPLAIGFDAMVKFPPHHLYHKRITTKVEPVDGFEGEIFDYAAAAERVNALADKGFPVYHGVMPGWDNTARRGKRARIFLGSTPELYEEWLHRVAQATADRPGDDDQFIFINAWNEWAEAATLEPSQQHGRAYLEATRAALERVQGDSAVEGVERRLNRRLAKLESRLETLDRIEKRYCEVDFTLQEHQKALHWLRDVGENLGKTATSSSRQLYELRRRLDDTTTRDLWFSWSYGVSGLLLKFPIWLFSLRLKDRLRWWYQSRLIRRSGLFDPDYYRTQYPEVKASGIDPIYHYVRCGAVEGRNPNPLFNGSRYLALYPELASSGDNPLLHYVTHRDWDTGLVDLGAVKRTGSHESTAPENTVISECPEPSAGPVAESGLPAAPRTVRWTLNQDQLAKRHTATTTLLFVSHDAARAGAQIYLLEVLKSFSRLPEYELYLLMRCGGELRADFERYAHVLDVQEHITSGESEESVVVDAVRAIGKPPGIALCNTVASGAVAKILDRLDLPVISIVHELPTTVESLGEQSIHDTVGSSHVVVVVSEFVKNALVERYGIPADRLVVLYVGVTRWQPADEFRDSARRRIFERYGLPDDAVLVLGCGSIHHRKGTDLFVQVARDAILEHGLDQAYFLWVGGDELSPLFRSWCEHDVATSGLRDRILFAGQQDHIVDYYLAADVFLLTSREDPFPLVNLEAMARGLPVIAFSGAGGAAEALVDGAGIVVPYLDTAEMTRALVRLVEAPRYHAAISQQALSRAQEHFRWDRFIGELQELVTAHVAPRESPRAARTEMQP